MFGTTTLKRAHIGRAAGCGAFLCLVSSIIAPAHGADTDWTGTWNTYWLNGRARLTLVQTGGYVTGTYVPGHGVISGTADGARLTGTWSEETRGGTFDIELSGDGQTFFGHFESGDWWTGQRAGAAEASTDADLSSPRATLRTFFIACNEIRAGKLESLEFATACLEIPPGAGRWLDAEHFDLATLFFDVVDQCTIRFSEIPDRVDGDEITFVISQAGTDVDFDVTARRRDSEWRLVVPSPGALDAKLREFLDARDQTSLKPNDYLQLGNPRATMRTFLEEYKHWNSGGSERVIATLDLSRVPRSIHEHEAPLLAAYLKQVIDRVSYVIWQEIPDDPGRQVPYVHFRHPRGEVVLAPVERDGGTVWTFTPRTLANIRLLYESLEDVPLARGLLPTREYELYFVVSEWVHRNAPPLTLLLAGLEVWQWIAIVLAILAAVLLAIIVNRVLVLAIDRRFERHGLASDRSYQLRLYIPLALNLGVAVTLWASRHLGLPLSVLPVVYTASMSLLTIGMTWIGYQLAKLVESFFYRQAQKTVSYYDELLVSLLGSIIKLAIIIVGFVVLAEAVGLPVRGVVAGVGVGSLAVAFAARDSIANVFGSAVLLADRPFKRGDLVAVAGYTGHVLRVGLRSTQIRTLNDSLVVIPNSLLASDVIDNLGRRRARLIEAKISVVYATPPEKIEAFTKGLLDLLGKHPKIETTRLSAGVWEFADSSIDLVFKCYMQVTTLEEERAERHRIFVSIMRLAHEMGVEFAFPTRTLVYPDEEKAAAFLGVPDPPAPRQAP
jgi:small-conductance mechanosensitive channel